jgi:hypothetical protein
MPTVHEHFSHEFQKWEMRGRGWQVFDQPVYPEPPFQPFAIRPMPETPDDGLRPTLLSSLVGKLSRKLSTNPPPMPPVIVEDQEPEPVPLIRDSLVELQVSLPADLDIGSDSFEHFFRNLALCREPVAFELLGTHGRVLTQFAASVEDASLVRKQLQAHFPDTMFRRQEGTLEKAWDASEGDEAFAVEFGLEREFMLPLATGKLDPFVGIVGALAELEPGELGLFQVLWQAVEHPWAENIVRSVTHNDGKPLFVNHPELASAADEKVARPLYAAVVRILLRTATTDRLHDIARELAGSLRAFANPQGNALIPLHNHDYPFEEHIEDALRRQSRRSGMLLNSDELIGFVHLPSSAVRSPALARDSGKTKAAPAIVRQSKGLYLGDNEHGGEIVPVYLSPDQRVRHTHIIGSSGTGKSSLLLSMIRQDIENGEGVAVLDPHGDLIDQILGIIPYNRIDDVVLVNPSDVEFPIGFNILQAHSEEEKNLLSSDLIAVFRRLSTSWGDQMDVVLQNAILAFLESSRGGTLADLRRFLLEPPYRSEFLQTVQDSELIYYWQKVFPQLSGGKSIGPILTRLQDFFSRKPLRNMVSQPENKLDFGQMMDSGKIFLAKLSEGLLGKENSYLLGTLLISKFQQLAMARQAQNVTARRDFWIYIDEFFNFITPSMAEILQGARKYRIGLTLAHHNLRQLQRDAEVASAVMTHPCTRIVFQVGDEDAKRLGDCFESFDAKSLKTLEKFHAIARVERNDFDFNLSFRKPNLPEQDEANSRKAEVVAASRSKYSTPRANVEAALLAGIRVEAKTPEPPPQPPKPASPPLPKDSEPKHSEVQKPTVSEKEIPSQPKEAAPPVISAPSPPREDKGIGGHQHNLIRERIEIVAREFGFYAAREKPTATGQKIDLALEKNNQTIGCEISIMTTVDHEVGNVAKCLKAGCRHVAVICVVEARLVKIQTAVSGTISAEDASRVGYYLPDQFIEYLKSLKSPEGSAATPQEATRDKYKVTRRAPVLTAEEIRQRENLSHKVFADTMRRTT